MKKIKLTKNKFAIIDNDDFLRISYYKWHYRAEYATRNSSRLEGKQTAILMHREILKLNKNNKFDVDHINGNKLDNRKINLRICTRSENQYNRKISKNNTSGYKGVSWHEGSNKWYARICLNYKSIFLGAFDSKELAAKAYNSAALKNNPNFAKLNNV